MRGNACDSIITDVLSIAFVFPLLAARSCPAFNCSRCGGACPGSGGPRAMWLRDDPRDFFYFCSFFDCPWTSLECRARAAVPWPEMLTEAAATARATCTLLMSVFAAALRLVVSLACCLMPSAEADMCDLSAEYGVHSRSWFFTGHRVYCGGFHSGWQRVTKPIAVAARRAQSVA